MSNPPEQRGTAPGDRQALVVILAEMVLRQLDKPASQTQDTTKQAA